MSRFAFYEIVRVCEQTETAGGLEGAVLGISTDDAGRVVAYAVYIYERERTAMFDPADLEPTGRFDRHENFYDGTSIRVSSKGELLGPVEGDAA